MSNLNRPTKSLIDTLIEAISLTDSHLKRHGSYAKLEAYRTLLMGLRDELLSAPNESEQNKASEWKQRSQILNNPMLFKVAGAIERQNIGLLPVWATVLIAGKLHTDSKPLNRQMASRA